MQPDPRLSFHPLAAIRPARMKHSRGKSRCSFFPWLWLWLASALPGTDTGGELAKSGRPNHAVDGQMTIAARHVVEWLRHGIQARYCSDFDPPYPVTDLGDLRQIS